MTLVFFNVYLSSKIQQVKASNVCGSLKAIIYIKDQSCDHLYSIFSSAILGRYVVNTTPAILGRYVVDTTPAILGRYVVDTTPCTVNETKKLLFNGLEKLPCYEKLPKPNAMRGISPLMSIEKGRTSMRTLLTSQLLLLFDIS